MLKETFYFVIQISENTEGDLGSMQHLGCNSCTAAIVSKCKPSAILTKSLVLDIARILYLPLKVTITTNVLVQKPHKQIEFFHKNKFC